MLKSMKLPPSDSPEEMAESVAEQQQYPYGLRIDLNEDSLESLGMVTMPQVGQKMIVTARVEVCSVSEYANQGGDKNQSVCLQITDMDLAPDKEKQDVQKKLYGS